MKKQDLLKLLDAVFLDKLFGFCYARTSDSYEAQELCSDIVFELVKAAGREGDIADPYPFIWRIAGNVYADFCDKRRKHDSLFYPGDPSDVFSLLAAEETKENDDGLLAAEIAKMQNLSETAVRQRLFSARKKIRSEVEEMKEMSKKPLALDTVEFVIWGTGNPHWGDPRNVCSRQFSKHIVWLCRKKPANAAEIADKLNVPTVYVEEELEILTKGENGEYGLLRRLDNGKYAVNFILLDREEMEEANGIYLEQLPDICRITSDFIEAHKQEYLAFPYRNKKADFNLILWQQITVIARAFSHTVTEFLSQKDFAGTKECSRPFSVYGYQANGKYYGGGWDGTSAENICGYSGVWLDNIYNSHIEKHFSCGHNISTDKQLQLAIRAIDGLDIASLTENEKEQAAKAVECGYLYREGEVLYTKILVSDIQDENKLFDVSYKLYKSFFEEAAGTAAEKLAAFIRRTVPEYLLPEWNYVNSLAEMPVFDALTEALIEKGILVPPENRLGAEGCWMQLRQ